MSSHFARATGSEMRTFRKSGGTLCTAPGEIVFLLINFILLCYAVRDQKLEIHMDDYGVYQALAQQRYPLKGSTYCVAIGVASALAASIALSFPCAAIASKT